MIDFVFMFNKVLEVIEIKEFFGVVLCQIEVFVYLEFLVYVLVGFNDGVFMVYVGLFDMCYVIGFVFYYLDCKDLLVECLDLVCIGQFMFKVFNFDCYLVLRFVWDVMEIGGMVGCIFNVVKEKVLDVFIDYQIGFLDMVDVVEVMLNKLVVDSCFINVEMIFDMVK